MSRTVRQIHDEWLVLRCQSGEAAALSELLSRWHERLLDHARRLMRHDADAADAVQEALIGIARSIHGLDDPALFGPWACRIVAHKCADVIKRHRKGRRVADEARSRAAADDEAKPGPEHDLARVRLAIEQLPLESQAILVMRYAREMDTRHIAGALGIPEGTVKSRLHHARIELKTVLERSL
jgi:RNA polymerase sigma-70 factor, ECF subfamily